jgi:hypothetical protein
MASSMSGHDHLSSNNPQVIKKRDFCILCRLSQSNRLVVAVGQEFGTCLAVVLIRSIEHSAVERVTGHADSAAQRPIQVLRIPAMVGGFTRRNDDRCPCLVFSHKRSLWHGAGTLECSRTPRRSTRPDFSFLRHLTLATLEVELNNSPAGHIAARRGRTQPARRRRTPAAAQARQSAARGRARAENRSARPRAVRCGRDERAAARSARSCRQGSQAG